ncbi:MAG: ABC transporter ATP-binding protein [Chitinophagaceae bacterium]
MRNIIEVENLHKQFGDFTAVSDLSFHVEEGDVYGFLGQNGAGKSTTIRMLLSLIKPGSGTIRLFGRALETHRSEVFSQTGAVIERPDLYKYLTAYENLHLFAKLSGKKVSRKDIMDTLELVGLAHRAQGRVHTFSQGMKQRLGIAIALVHDPPLVILDEPTNGLDPQGIADIRNLILRLSRERKKTVLVSSHLLSEIERIATRMIIIHEGKKMVEGSVRELLDPEKNIVEIAVHNVAGVHALLLNAAQWQDALEPVSGPSVKLRLHPEKVPQLNTFLVENQVQVLAISSRHSLEDYFLLLTNTRSYVADITT